MGPQNSPPPKHILTISRDRNLQQSRTLLMQHLGYTVTPLLGETELRDFMAQPQRPTLDLVLICHTLPEPRRAPVCDALRLAYPKTPILMLYNGYDPTTAKVDGSIQNTGDPHMLINGLALLLGKPNTTTNAP